MSGLGFGEVPELRPLPHAISCGSAAGFWYRRSVGGTAYWRMTRPRGFTLVELMVAVVVFEFGLLGLLSTTAAVTRMIARGRRAARAATFATQRLERLRTTACGSQAGGSEVWPVTGTPLDSLSWRFVNAGNQHWQVVLRTGSLAERGAWRVDSLETEISCLF